MTTTATPPAPGRATTRPSRQGRARTAPARPGAVVDPRRRTHRARERERGSVSLELAVLFPVVLLLVFAIVQYGLWFHARSLALAAAQEGVTAARTYTANPAAGPGRARQFLDVHAGDLISDITISTSTDPTLVRVQVTGRSLSLLPGTPGPTVDQVAEAPIERFTTAGGP